MGSKTTIRPIRLIQARQAVLDLVLEAIDQRDAGKLQVAALAIDVLDAFGPEV